MKVSMEIDTDQFETRIFAPGEIILHQDQTGKKAYLIKQGKVRVYLQRNGRVVDLAELGPGQIVGEMSLLTGHKNAATVEAVEEVQVAVITKQIIMKKIAASDPLVRELVKMLVERIRSTDSALLKSETREFIEIDFI